MFGVAFMDLYRCVTIASGVLPVRRRRQGPVFHQEQHRITGQDPIIFAGRELQCIHIIGLGGGQIADRDFNADPHHAGMTVGHQVNQVAVRVPQALHFGQSVPYDQQPAVTRGRQLRQGIAGMVDLQDRAVHVVAQLVHAAAQLAHMI